MALNGRAGLQSQLGLLFLLDNARAAPPVGLPGEQQVGKQLDLFTTPSRIGPLAAMALIELALRRQIVLTQDDLNELEHIVIDLIRRLEDELLACVQVDDDAAGG